jgi:hypothetical protein
LLCKKVLVSREEQRHLGERNQPQNPENSHRAVVEEGKKVAVPFEE